ncbi:MAG: 5-(carboxyamino)imidazole ribonucleotide synthase [Deltaproteobacteria bacterium]|nr:MAG: 5-(carboxyamino)imidazole ribonucleotide synthase [Deltaproteobacteria bacterium]
MSTHHLPGATVGIIGGGQLARMMALEARRMGYRVSVLAPRADDPAVPLADLWIPGQLDDVEAAQRLAESADVVTVDSEHVPASLLSDIERLRPVRPSAAVLRTIQDRGEQRRFLERISAPQPRCVAVDSVAELAEAANTVGFPCVLKSRHAGYDGKGQAVIRSADQLEASWEKVGRAPSMLEEFVPFDAEISVLLARAPNGEMRFYPAAYNVHRRHVLHATMAPAPIERSVEQDAREIARSIAEELDHVGMLAVEMFLVGSKLLVNEVAPRPHNSGHYTFGACATSQFEQHVRAVLGLPLGDPSLSRPAVMLNLFGDLWRDGNPDWMPVLSRPEARLHLYGKTEPRPGRKMGHVLLLDDDPHRALQNGEAMLDSLAADRSRNQWSSPTGSKRAAGTRLSPICIALKIGAFSRPATRKAARRQLSSTG